MQDIKVTVCCLTHNLEKYVRQAIDGFVMQKTNFKYEVLIHDDASTDRTPSIIQEYAEKYPERIKPIYQKENMHKRRINILQEILFPMAKGKYIAMCDGDDYWTDENKLQKQYDALETHENCSICVHRNKMIKDDDKFYEDFIPSKKTYKWETGVIEQQEILKYLVNYPFQTACYFFRKENMKPFIDGKLYNYYTFEDQTELYMGAVNGDFYFFDSDMAVYRMNCPSSASMRIRNDTSHFKNFVDKKIKIIESINRYTDYKFDNYFKRDVDVMRFRLRSALEKRNYEKEKIKNV